MGDRTMQPFKGQWRNAGTRGNKKTACGRGAPPLKGVAIWIHLGANFVALSVPFHRAVRFSVRGGFHRRLAMGGSA